MTFEFEYLGKFELVFEKNLGSEARNQVGSFDGKKTEVKNLTQVYL
jgi:hypothetical protein